MEKSASELLREWRQTANELLARNPADSEGEGYARALLRCADDVEGSLNAHRNPVFATATLAATLFLTEPFLEQRPIGGDSSLVMPAQSGTKVPMDFPTLPSDHTQEENDSEGTIITVSSMGSSGSNVSVKVVNLSVSVGNDLRA